MLMIKKEIKMWYRLYYLRFWNHYIYIYTQKQYIPQTYKFLKIPQHSIAIRSQKSFFFYLQNTSDHPSKYRSFLLGHSITQLILNGRWYEVQKVIRRATSNRGRYTRGGCQRASYVNVDTWSYLMMCETREVMTIDGKEKWAWSRHRRHTSETESPPRDTR